MSKRPPQVLTRRAVRIVQTESHPIYLFGLAASEILDVADISRVSRDEAGRLLGYQRPEVKRHIDEIREYIDSEGSLFPHPLIMALSSDVRWVGSRGPGASDGVASAGMLEIPLPAPGEAKPGWLVDGQQRALALAQASRSRLPVPISGFVADTVDLQRDQFLRINNSKPLPRGLVTELLPEVSSPLPPRLAAKKIPSALCDLLQKADDSPFRSLIIRPSASPADRKRAVVTDTSIVKVLEESLGSPSGCLFPYRNIATNETDFAGIWALLTVYWRAVAETFPEAWGKKPTRSRLMHGAGIRAMGRLMDKIMASLDPTAEGSHERVMADLALVAPMCRWTSGVWEGLGNLPWNAVQNVPKHVSEISNLIIRTYVQKKLRDQ